MHRPRHFFGERRIHGALAGDPVLAFKTSGGHDDVKMRLSALPVAHMAAMAFGLVFDIEMRRVKCSAEFLVYCVGDFAQWIFLLFNQFGFQPIRA